MKDLNQMISLRRINRRERVNDAKEKASDVKWACEQEKSAREFQEQTIANENFVALVGIITVFIIASIALMKLL